MWTWTFQLESYIKRGSITGRLNQRRDWNSCWVKITIYSEVLYGSLLHICWIKCYWVDATMLVNFISNIIKCIAFLWVPEFCLLYLRLAPYDSSQISWESLWVKQIIYKIKGTAGINWGLSSLHISLSYILEAHLVHSISNFILMIPTCMWANVMI